MKKLPLYLMIMVSLSIFSSTIFAAEKESTEVVSNAKKLPAEVKVMFIRLEEIKKMDKSSMSTSEKKELRKEVRTIKAELKTTGNGVYYSIGAIIIIILILIVLL
ncbi:MAG: hypothetical protein H7Y10_01395 [Flavobacterium sp.]|nr:hypothetical protein [Flavobacterium sp.]